MQVCIVRHGIAIDREDPASPPDPDRYLTPKGVDRTRKAAAGLKVLGLQPDLILTSPYRRAAQTAEIVADAFGYPADKIETTETLLPDAPAKALFAHLSRLKHTCVVCVGHAPHVDEAVALALGAKRPVTELKKAGAALIDLPSLSPPHGILHWLHTAKSLRQIAG